MEEKDVVYLERKDNGIAVIYLNQPRKKNAISAVMMDKLSGFLTELDRDKDIRVILLRGAGENFSTGGDLSQGGPDMTIEDSRNLLKRYVAAVRTIRQIGKPVIAVTDGYVVGGAVSLVLACDLVIASEKTVFIPNFCAIGIIPEMGIMAMLPQLVGPQRAKDILFFGRRFGAKEGCDMGIVNQVVSREELVEKALEYAAGLSAISANSVSIVKGIMNGAADPMLNAVMEAESTASPFCTRTREYKEMAARFSKK